MTEHTREDQLPLVMTLNVSFVNWLDHVFKSWSRDTNESIDKMVAFDFMAGRLPGIIKDDYSQTEFKNIMANYYPTFKDTFLTTAIQSNFPFVTREEFARFCRRVDLCDKVVT